MVSAVFVPVPPFETPRVPLTCVERLIVPLVCVERLSVPVTPVLRGKPVQLVSVPLEGVPSTAEDIDGLVSTALSSVGAVDRTLLPDPVDVVTPVPPFRTFNTPPRVYVPEVVIAGGEVKPLMVNPVLPAPSATLVTVPEDVAVTQLVAPVPSV